MNSSITELPTESALERMDFNHQPHIASLQKIDPITHAPLPSEEVKSGILQFNVGIGKQCILMKHYIPHPETYTPQALERIIYFDKKHRTSATRNIHEEAANTWILLTDSGSCYRLVLQEPFACEQQSVEPAQSAVPERIAGVRALMRRMFGGKRPS